MSTEERPAANTDHELLRENTGDPAGSYYENSVHVTADGNIGMNVGGTVYTLPITKWHALAAETVGRDALVRDAFETLRATTDEIEGGQVPDCGWLHSQGSIDRWLIARQDWELTEGPEWRRLHGTPS